MKTHWCPSFRCSLKGLTNCEAFALISLIISRKGGTVEQFISCICERRTSDTPSCWEILNVEENRCLNLDYKLFILRPIIYYCICKSSAAWEFIIWFASRQVFFSLFCLKGFLARRNSCPLIGYGKGDKILYIYP